MIAFYGALHTEMRFRKSPDDSMIGYLVCAGLPRNSDVKWNGNPNTADDGSIRVFSDAELKALEDSGAIPPANRKILITDLESTAEEIAKQMREEGAAHTVISRISPGADDVHAVSAVYEQELSANAPSGMPVLTDLRESGSPVYINGAWNESTWENPHSVVAPKPDYPVNSATPEFDDSPSP